MLPLSALLVMIDPNELLDVVTRAVNSLQLDWPQGKRDHQTIKITQQKSWSKPYSSCVFVPVTSIYSTIIGAKAQGYTTMPQVEEIL